jgi:2-C-methyl-D-erythritol 4-phosphate cytidylyltransferase
MEGIDKLWHPISGKPLLAHTVNAFEQHPDVDAIVLVTSADRVEDARILCRTLGWKKVVSVAAGGDTRRNSARIGLSEAARAVKTCETVMIHDGARPLVPASLITAGVRTLADSGAAIPALAVSDTVKEVDRGAVVETCDRTRLALAQTPQFFRLALIVRAQAAAPPEMDVSDDAMLVERFGERVATFPGSPTNIKVTTRDDLRVAEALLAERREP